MDTLSSQALCGLGSVIFISESVPFRQHAFMQNAGDQNPPGLAPEENNMLALFPAIKTGADVAAGTAGRGIVGKLLAACFQLIHGADGLGFAPRAQRIRADAQQISFGKTR
jgi:hypothetical protein